MVLAGVAPRELLLPDAPGAAAETLEARPAHGKMQTKRATNVAMRRRMYPRSPIAPLRLKGPNALSRIPAPIPSASTTGSVLWE